MLKMLLNIKGVIGTVTNLSVRSLEGNRTESLRKNEGET